MTLRVRLTAVARDLGGGRAAGLGRGDLHGAALLSGAAHRPAARIVAAPGVVRDERAGVLRRRTRRPATAIVPARGNLRRHLGRVGGGRRRPDSLRRTAARCPRPPTSRSRSRPARWSDPTLLTVGCRRTVRAGYRVIALGLTDGSALVVAVPLTEMAKTLAAAPDHRGLGDRRGARHAGAPLSRDRSSRPSSAGTDRGDRRGDRGGRPVPAGRADRSADRGGSAGCVAQRDARPDRGRHGRAARIRGGAATVPGRRVARAADPAHVDPRVRGAVPPGRRRRTPPTPRSPCVASNRRASGWACSWRICCSLRARDRAVRSRTNPWISFAWPQTRSRMLEPSIRSRAIELDAPDALSVVGDEGRLRQVFANLLSNALTHTPAGTAVAVRVRADDGWAELEVSDAAPGSRRRGSGARVRAVLPRGSRSRSRSSRRAG